MKTMGKKNKSDKGSERKRLVCDLRGTIYELENKLSEGGQGVVCYTQFPNVLVKVSKFPKEDPRAKAWFDHIQWVSRQPLDGLKIARPQALIDKPRHGYVMELMDGLEPLQHLLGLSLEAAKGGNGPHFFIESGGLSRRMRLLTALARTLAALHGRGLAYGDLAPSNVFVSRTREHAEVWLIDSDNISVLSREGGQKIYTPEYGAPEIIRGISGIDSLTDSWSFGVIAFQLLTLQHPLIGDLVGEILDPRVPVARQRYQVKRALHWRRRKGTPAQLEALAWIVSGFKARVTEPSGRGADRRRYAHGNAPPPARHRAPCW